MLGIALERILLSATCHFVRGSGANRDQPSVTVPTMLSLLLLTTSVPMSVTDPPEAA